MGVSESSSVSADRILVRFAYRDRYESVLIHCRNAFKVAFLPAV